MLRAVEGRMAGSIGLIAALKRLQIPATIPAFAGQGIQGIDVSLAEEPQTAGSPGGRWQTALGDLSGAFADLGTFLPLVIGVLAVRGMDATGVLIGFGLFALMVAMLYRRPVPVQPMKAVAAVAIASGLAPESMAAGGLMIGAVLVLLAATGLIERIARWLPQSVLAGLQLGIGGHLVLMGLGMISESLWLGGLALVALAATMQTRLRPLACPLVLVAAVTWGVTAGGLSLPDLGFGWHWPVPSLPDWDATGTAAVSLVLPQLALTLTNAVILTAAFAADYFPDDKKRISTRNLALSTGAANLVLAPFGAIPMCHGAGGMVAHVKFGARTGLAPAIFGLACLALGIGFGPEASRLLALVPLAAVGALLTIAGADLAVSKRLFDSRPSCLAVILATAAAAIAIDVAVGLAVGIVAEGLRTAVIRHLAQRREG